MADEQYFTKMVDGQLSVATVAQSGEIIPEESRPGDKYTTALVQTDDGPQLCVKTYDLNGGGGGGGGTVDQTYDPTSTNAQSGTAVAEAVAPALKNTATATGSLVILGTPTWGQNSITIGNSATAYAHGAVAIGQNTYITNGIGVAIGSSATVNGSGVGIGYNAKAEGASSIQLGNGTNSTANSFQVFNYQMLDANGHIPNERIYYPQPQYKAYTITGSDVTVDNNNVATGFKSYGDNNINNSYLLVNEKIPTITTTLEVIIEFKVASVTGDAPLICKNDTNVRSFYLKQVSGESYYHIFRWDGTANAEGVTNIQPNTTYQLKYIFNNANSSTESCYLLVNNEWVEQWPPAANKTDLFGGQAVGIGGAYRYGGGYIDGNIYLDNTAIYANGNMIFGGAKNFIPATQGITGIQGYNATKTQVLKNVNGTLTWVDE